MPETTVGKVTCSSVRVRGCRCYHPSMATIERAETLALTEAAAAKIKELQLLEPEGEANVLRVAVQGGGCSGFEYALGFDRGLQEGDHELESRGVTVVVDPFSAPYSRAPRSTSTRSPSPGSRSSNPNATSACGCGHSFQVEEGQGVARGHRGGRPRLRLFALGLFRHTLRLLAVIVRRDEKVRLISRIPLFESCSQAERARFATILTCSSTRRRGADARGRTRRAVLRPRQGPCRGAQRETARSALSACATRARSRCWTNAPRMATVRTTSPVTALEATREGFSALLDTSPRIERKLLKALADRPASAAI